MVLILGKTLQCQIKLQNFLNKYAVAAVKKGKIDGHFSNGERGRIVKTVKGWTP